MVLFPHCKINLGLHVIRKRADGYHDLETCFYPVPLTDMLEIIPSDTLRFSASGNAIPGKDEDNLCLKAYALLKLDFDIPPVNIHLHKVIPTGAGLGGGSSDAAFTLRLLHQLFSIGLSGEELIRKASMLGSDCAFFVQDKPMMGTGRGEVLTPSQVSLKGKYLVLIKPDIHVSTAEAYAGIRPKEPSLNLTSILESYSMYDWRHVLNNDFEESVFHKHPRIGQLKKYLYDTGAVYACMSGSGATVFGIFDHEPEITIPDNDAFVWKGRL